MICYDKRYLRMARLNTVVEPHYEKDEEGKEVLAGYIYADKTTYTDCVLLHSKFDNNMAAINSQLGIDGKHLPAIEYYFNHAPYPFNILAPFLGLISSSIELEQDVEELTSRLFVMSKSIGFNSFVSIPKNMRVNILFAASEFARYKEDIDEYKNFMYEAMKEESPSEVIYINTEEVARFAQFIELFRDMGLFNGTASTTYLPAPATVAADDYVDTSNDNLLNEDGEFEEFDFSSLMSATAQLENSSDSTKTTLVSNTSLESSVPADAGALITDDAGVAEDSGPDILDQLTMGFGL